MNRLVPFWVLLAFLIWVASLAKAAALSYPYALTYLADTWGWLLGGAALVIAFWGIRRRRLWIAHLRELLAPLGWIVLGWSAAGWWTVAVETDAMGAAVCFLPGLCLGATMLVSAYDKPTEPGS